MFELRPVGYVFGLIIAVMGGMMLIPMAVDLAARNGHAPVFMQCAGLSVLAGGMVALACANGRSSGLTIRQAFVLTAGIWLLVPLFAALPFMLGATQAGFTDAYFEAVSGITTTGSTVFVGLDTLPAGLLLWRGLLNWMGGLGIVIVAMIFLPVMRVGGMQFFRTAGFDTMGKVLPRALDISRALFQVYAALTALCAITFLSLGMGPLDAAVHAMTTISTGGFSTRDISFGGFSPMLQAAAGCFMILGSLPYVRFVQLAGGNTRSLLSDPQVTTYLRWLATGILVVLIYRWASPDGLDGEGLRIALFNLTSIMSGTGFFVGHFEGWGPFVVMVAFMMGFIGGCTASSSGGISVFRMMLVFSAIRSQIALIHAPHRIAPVRYDGRVVGDEVIDQVILYTCGYFAVVFALSIAMTLTGVDAASAVFAIWTSIGNIGFGLGPMVARTGTMVDVNDAAKWLMIVAMVMGRLGLLAVFVLLSRRFWRI